MKKISIIIPCYNVEKYIDRCMESLVHQTIGIEHLEIILVDDASTDSTAEKLKQWEQNYEESVLLVLCEKNGRQGTARNIGMEYATSDYITYVDSDDWIDHEMLLEMYEIMESDQDLDLVAVKSGNDLGDGTYCNVPFTEKTQPEYRNINTTEDRHKLIREGIGGGVWGKLYRKQFLFSSNLYFPENLTYEDNFFGTLLLFYLKKYCILCKRYYHYFFNPRSTVVSQNAIHHFDRLFVQMMTDEEIRKRGFWEEFQTEAETVFLRLYYINTLHIVFTRFSTLPYKTLSNMQKEVLRRYPNCLQSIAFQQMNREEKELLKTLRWSFGPKEWNELAGIYQDYWNKLETAYYTEKNKKENHFHETVF